MAKTYRRKSGDPRGLMRKLRKASREIRVLSKHKYDEIEIKEPRMKRSVQS